MRVEDPSICSVDEEELETFIQDWYWDCPSLKYARDVGRFLLGFISSLEVSGLRQKTLRKHTDNCWAIGFLECQYGFRKKFHPSDLAGGPSYEYEYGRKFSDTGYALRSYRSTWRKLDKYIALLHGKS